MIIVVISILLRLLYIALFNVYTPILKFNNAEINVNIVNFTRRNLLNEVSKYE